MSLTFCFTTDFDHASWLSTDFDQFKCFIFNCTAIKLIKTGF